MAQASRPPSHPQKMQRPQIHLRLVKLESHQGREPAGNHTTDRVTHPEREARGVDVRCEVEGDMNFVGDWTRAGGRENNGIVGWWWCLRCLELIRGEQSKKKGTVRWWWWRWCLCHFVSLLTCESNLPALCRKVMQISCRPRISHELFSKHSKTPQPTSPAVTRQCWISAAEDETEKEKKKEKGRREIVL